MEVTTDERIAKLEEAIEDYSEQGFTVDRREEFSAKLVKPYQPSKFWLVLWTIFGLLIGGVLYMFWAYGRSKIRAVVRLQVNRDGKLVVQRDSEKTGSS